MAQVMPHATRIQEELVFHLKMDIKKLQAQMVNFQFNY